MKAPAAAPTIERLQIAAITQDGGTQTRATLNDVTIMEYAEALIAGDEFPPCVVYYDKKTYWLSEGFHRIAANERAGYVEIDCEVRPGNRLDAFTNGLLANDRHGLRVTNADKRYRVNRALTEWPKWSDNKLAEICGVSQPFVSGIRTAAYNGSKLPEREGKDGKVYDTTNIGSRTAVAPPKPDDYDDPKTKPSKASKKSAESEPTRPEAESDPAPNIHFSSASDEWLTPPDVLDRVIAVLGAIDLDPCSNEGEPNVPAAAHYTKEDNGLAQPWKGRVFVNPPYGDEVAAWVTRTWEAYESDEIREAILLVASRTDTAWFRSLRAYHRCFVSGRLHFSGAPNPAPFPSVVFYLGTKPKRFITEFASLGDIYKCVS